MDGSLVMPLVPETTDLYDFAWSPTADILAVGYGQDTYFSPVHAEIDPITGEVLREIRRSGSLLSEFSSGFAFWDATGQSSYLTAGGVITRLGADNRHDIWELTSYGGGNVFLEMQPLFPKIDVTIHHLMLNQTLAIQDTNETSRRPDYALYWGMHSELGLIQKTHCTDQSACSTSWLIADFADQSITPIEISSGLSPATSFNCELVTCTLRYTTDGSAIAMQDKDGVLFIVDFDKRVVVPVSDAPIRYWQWVEQTLFFQTDEGLHNFDKVSGDVAKISAPVDLFCSMKVSPDGRYVGFASMDVTIQSLDDGSIQTWDSYSESNTAGLTASWVWSEDSQWFISGANDSNFDNSCLTYYAMIHQVGNPERRELGVCLTVETCTGFLPDRVLPHLGEATQNEQADDD